MICRVCCHCAEIKGGGGVIPTYNRLATSNGKIATDALHAGFNRFETDLRRERQRVNYLEIRCHGLRRGHGNPISDYLTNRQINQVGIVETTVCSFYRGCSDRFRHRRRFHRDSFGGGERVKALIGRRWGHRVRVTLKGNRIHQICTGFHTRRDHCGILELDLFAGHDFGGGDPDDLIAANVNLAHRCRCCGACPHDLGCARNKG